MASFSFFWFMAYSDQSGNQIPNVWSVKLLILQRLKTELKNLWQRSHTTALNTGTICDKNTIFYQKNADISKVKVVLVVKGIFSETTCVFLHTKFHVSSIILTSFKLGLTPTCLYEWSISWKCQCHSSFEMHFVSAWSFRESLKIFIFTFYRFLSFSWTLNFR